MMNTLRNIQDLCKALRAITRLQHVSIVFIENEIATWSTGGKPRMSMGPWHEHADGLGIQFVLYLFATLSNLTRATIQLPGSIPDNLFLHKESKSTLQDMKARHEQSMMNHKLLDEEYVKWFVEVLEEDLDEEEMCMRQATGSISLAKFKAQGYGDEYTIEGGHFNHFTKIWLHIDSLSSVEYEGDRKYLCFCPGQIFHSPECRVDD